MYDGGRSGAAAVTPVSPTCSPPRARWQRLGSARHASITARDGQFFPFFGGGGKVELRSVKVRLCDVPFERELNLDCTAKRGTHCHSSSIHSLGIKYSANQIDIIRDIASQSDRANQTDSNVLSRFHPRGCMGYHLCPALVLLARQETAPREGAVGCGLPRVWSLLSAVRPLASLSDSASGGPPRRFQRRPRASPARPRARAGPNSPPARAALLSFPCAPVEGAPGCVQRVGKAPNVAASSLLLAALPGAPWSSPPPSPTTAAARSTHSPSATLSSAGTHTAGPGRSCRPWRCLSLSVSATTTADTHTARQAQAAAAVRVGASLCLRCGTRRGASAAAVCSFPHPLAPIPPRFLVTTRPPPRPPPLPSLRPRQPTDRVRPGVRVCPAPTPPRPAPLLRGAPLAGAKEDEPRRWTTSADDGPPRRWCRRGIPPPSRCRCGPCRRLEGHRLWRPCQVRRRGQRLRQQQRRRRGQGHRRRRLGLEPPGVALAPSRLAGDRGGRGGRAPGSRSQPTRRLWRGRLWWLPFLPP